MGTESRSCPECDGEGREDCPRCMGSNRYVEICHYCAEPDSWATLTGCRIEGEVVCAPCNANARLCVECGVAFIRGETRCSYCRGRAPAMEVVR